MISLFIIDAASEIAAQITAIVGTAAILWKSASSTVKFKKRIDEHLEQSAYSRQKVDEMSRRIEIVEHEVLHNSGSSLKDISARIEAKLDFTMEWDDKAYFMSNREGFNFWVNKTYVVKSGALSKEDLLGMNWRDYIDNLEEYDEKWVHAFEQHRQYSGTVKFKNGSVGTIRAKPTDNDGYIGSITFEHENNCIHPHS